MKRWLSVLLLASANVMALEVIDLGWRDGREVAEALSPHLQTGESVSALGRQLILDAPPARLIALRRLVRTLDVRPVNLRVEVEQSGSARQSGSALSIGGGVRIGNVQLGIGSGGERHIGIGGQGGGVVIGADASQNQGRSQHRQTLRLLDNHSGFIESGSSRPLPWRLVTPQGGVIRGAGYQDAVTGFYVRPRLTDSRVLVELAARQESFSGRGIERDRLSTTVEGAVGEWLDIGGVGLDEQGQQVVLIGAARQLRSIDKTLRIRIQPDN